MRSTLSAGAASFRQQLAVRSRSAQVTGAAVAASRAFSQSALLASNDKGYEKHRVEVDPKMAGVDSSITFEHPKVRPSHLRKRGRCMLADTRSAEVEGPGRRP